MAQFEGYERREAKILGVLKEYGISSIDECKDITLAKGIDVDQIVRTNPILSSAPSTRRSRST